MLKTTFIARASDGLILCETYDSTSDQQIERLKINARDLLKKKEMFGREAQCSVDIEDHRFHFLSRQGIVFLAIADKRYTQKLAFVFLNEISAAFEDELRNTYGSTSNIDFSSKIETIDNQYAFLKFERVVLKKRKEFKDMNAEENIERLNQELIDVNKIMTESFEMLLNRDNNLQKIQDRSTQLRDSSKDLRKGAKNLKLAFLFRKYMTPLILCGMLTMFILLYFFVI